MLKLSALIRKFLAWASRRLSVSSVAVYRHYFLKFLAYHGDKRIKHLKPCHLSEWAETWHQAQAMRRLFKWATDEAQLTTRNPFANVPMPPKGERKRIMSRRECVGILRRTSRDFRTLLIGHRETFARPQELRVVTWRDVRCDDPDLDTSGVLLSGRACIVLHEFKQRRKRRIPSGPRVILLSPRACRLLLRLLARTPDAGGPIFLTKRSRAWTPNAVRCRFRRLRKRIGLARDERGENVVPYTFRHTGATLASAAGVRDRALADVLGHVETSTTARYQHLSVEHLRAALKPLWERARPRKEIDKDTGIPEKSRAVA